MKNFRKLMLSFFAFSLILLGGNSLNNDTNLNVSDSCNSIDETSSVENKDIESYKIHDGNENHQEIRTFSSPEGLSGSGTTADPYLINNLDNFKTFASFINSLNYVDTNNYKLTCDLEINNTNYSDFKPIGSTYNYRFGGVFDGENHEIKFNYNFTCVSSQECYSLFGYAGGKDNTNPTVIKNLKIQSNVTCTVNSNLSVLNCSGLVGYIYYGKCIFENISGDVNLKTIFDSSEDRTINSRYCLGGLVGYNYGYPVFNNIDINESIDSFTSLNKTLNIASGYFGGILGFADASWTAFDDVKLTVSKFNIGSSSKDVVFTHELNIGGVLGFTSRPVVSFNNINCKFSNFNIYSKYTYNTLCNFGLLVGAYDSTNPDLYSFDGNNIRVLVTNKINLKIDSNNAWIGLFFGMTRNIKATISNLSIIFNGLDFTGNTSVSNNFFGGLSGQLNNGNFKLVNSYIYQASGEISLKGGMKAYLLFSEKNFDTTRNVINIQNSYVSLKIKSGIETIPVPSSHYSNYTLTNFYSNITLTDTLSISDFVNSNLEDLNNAVEANNAIEGATLYTRWTLARKNGIYPTFGAGVTFKADGLEDRAGYISFEDGTNNLAETIVYDGYELNGLYLERVGETYSSEVTVDSLVDAAIDRTVYVKLTKIDNGEDDEEEEEESGPSLPIGTEFDIIYDTKDGTINDANYVTSYVCGIGAKLPTSVTKANYDFAGWSYRNLNGVIITEISPRQYGDVYLNANYTISANAKKYTIEYVNNEGKINGDYKTSYLDEEVELPTDVTSDYGKFVGWYDNPEFTGRRVYKISDTDTGNKTYYARYMFNRYEIDYEVSDSEEIVEYYYYEDEVTLLNNFTKDGYTFVGLSETKGDDTNLVTKINKGESGDKTYYVIFKENAKETDLTWLWILLGVVGLGAIVGGVCFVNKKRKVSK